MKRVLVVTDDAGAQQMFQTMLASDGFDVLVQPSLVDGCESAAAAFQPDVVLIEQVGNLRAHSETKPPRRHRSRCERKT